MALCYVFSFAHVSFPFLVGDFVFVVFYLYLLVANLLCQLRRIRFKLISEIQCQLSYRVHVFIVLA